MKRLDQNIRSVATQMPKLKGLSPKDAADRFYQIGVSEWNKLSAAERETLNNSATDGQSGFYVFLSNKATEMLSKTQ